MADIKSLCFGEDCFTVPEADDFATKQELAAKQDALTAGDGIDITNDEISVKPGEVFVSNGGSLSNQTIAADSRKAFTISGVAPNGYSIAAYRQISISGVSGEEWKKCFVQFFSTTGGGKNAQVAIVNTATTAASINITVTCLCMKDSA